MALGKMSVTRGNNPVKRREFMQIGAMAIGGLSLPQILQGRRASDTLHKDNSVILLYLNGGPSHMETYDMKPYAPLAYRSVFPSIKTNVSGIDICELFPLQAKLADKFAIVRSCHHTMSSHSDGGIQVMTGKTPPVPDPTSTSKSLHPDFGHIASKFCGPQIPSMPPYVSSLGRVGHTRPVYLGLEHSSLTSGNPSSRNYSPIGTISTGKDGEGLSNRRSLLKQFDQFRHGLDLRGNVPGLDGFRQQAFGMLTSPKAAEAFNLDKESDSLRDRYGHHSWGQSCLLARRLAEAGTVVSTISINTPKNGQEFTNWDDHIMNASRPGHFGKYMKIRLPYLDQCLSALIEDIYERDLDKRIMIVVMGEFGRTPRLSSNKDGVGRNHWPQAYSVLFSGGGLKTGQVVGATNSKGEYPAHRPYTPEDVLATIYQHLGINYSAPITDYSGRPHPILKNGKPIPELT